MDGLTLARHGVESWNRNDFEAIYSDVDAPASGVQGAYEWSFLLTARNGAVVMYEFFLDHDRALAAVGLA